MTLAKTDKTAAKTFLLSKRLAVEITVGLGGMTVEWDSVMPAKLTTKELYRYRQGRNEMLRRLAEMVGGSVVVVET